MHDRSSGSQRSLLAGKEPTTCQGQIKTSARLLLTSLALIVVLAGLCFAEEPSNSRRFLATGHQGAVSCGHPLAAAAALQILKNGGNAVDAAVAAGFMLGVVDFSNSGIGGDGFALVCTPEGRVTAFDGSTRWPGMKKQKNVSSYIGLPTVPELLLKLLRLYGQKPATEVMAPAVFACIKGFKTTAYLEKVVEKKLVSVKDAETIAFLAPEGYPLRAGQVFKQPRLAKTLMQMAADGGRSFYSGDEAKQTIADMHRRGSLYQLEDFSRYHSQPIKPLRYDYRGFSIYGTPPPSCSLATIKLTMDLLNNGLKLFPQSGRELLALAQAGKKVIATKYQAMAACKDNHARFFAMVDNFEEPAATFDPSVTDTNTTHLCVWDKNGLIVSMTLTLGNHFGTGELAPGGFFYNNGLRNYSDQVANYPPDYPASAGPVSAKSPIIVTRNGKAVIALGGAGADRIIFNTGLTLARVLAGHDVQKSVSAPRFYLDYLNRLSLEWQPDLKLLNDTKSLITSVDLKAGCDDFFGLVSIIVKNNGSLLTAADQRRDGSCGAEP